MTSGPIWAVSQLVGEDEVEDEEEAGDCLAVLTCWPVWGGRLGLMLPDEACWAFMTGGGGVEAPILDRGVIKGFCFREAICLGSTCRGLPRPLASIDKDIWGGTEDASLRICSMSASSTAAWPLIGTNIPLLTTPWRGCSDRRPRAAFLFMAWRETGSKIETPRLLLLCWGRLVEGGSTRMKRMLSKISCWICSSDFSGLAKEECWRPRHSKKPFFPSELVLSSCGTSSLTSLESAEWELTLGASITPSALCSWGSVLVSALLLCEDLWKIQRLLKRGRPCCRPHKQIMELASTSSQISPPPDLNN